MYRKRNFLDTYFLDAKTALEVAKRSNYDNMYDFYLPQAVYLQICYYNADKPLENAPKNCIFVPLEKIYDYFLTTEYRTPETISFEKADISKKEQTKIKTYFQKMIAFSKEDRRKLMFSYLERIKKQEPNFKDKKLRVFMHTYSSTMVHQFVMKDVANEFRKKTNYEVEIYTFECEMQSLDSFKSVKKIYEYNPHIIFYINTILNENLNEKTYHFSWIQDPMEYLQNDDKMLVRKRDYFLSYHQVFTDALLKKGIPKEKISIQYFGYSSDIMFKDEKIEKENKIIFLGSYYSAKDRILPHIYNNEKMYQDLIDLVDSGDSLSVSNIQKIYKKYNYKIEKYDSIINLQQALIRNQCIEWITSIKDINFELYGAGWEETKHKDIFKGSLCNKEDVRKLYNSTKYVLLPSGSTINTQRLAETVGCESIAVMYDSRDITPEKEHWDDEILYFKTKDELEYILKNNVIPKKKISKKMKDFFSYKKIIQHIDGIVREDIKKYE